MRSRNRGTKVCSDEAFETGWTASNIYFVTCLRSVSISSKILIARRIRSFAFPLSTMLTTHLVLALALAITRVSATTTQTLASLPAFTQQRSCATSCFWDGDPNNGAKDVLGIKLGCCANSATCQHHAADSCFCRADLSSVATSWLSECALRRCSSNAVDVSSAIGVYNEYCMNKWVFAPGVVTGTVTNKATSATTAAGTPVQTGGPASAVTVYMTRSGQNAVSSRCWVSFSCILVIIVLEYLGRMVGT